MKMLYTGVFLTVLFLFLLLSDSWIVRPAQIEASSSRNFGNDNPSAIRIVDDGCNRLGQAHIVGVSRSSQGPEDCCPRGQ